MCYNPYNDFSHHTSNVDRILFNFSVFSNLFIILKSKITKILNFEEYQKRKVPNQMAKSNELSKVPEL